MTNMKSPDDLWSPFKYLNATVDTALNGSAGQQNAFLLETVLRQHKQSFCSLLKNPPKNEVLRDQIRRGVTEGVILPGVGHIILSEDLVEKSLIVSDMFNLNEYNAVQLMCTAQQQVPQNPGLPPGLVAVLLYYDGRKAIVATLKELFQARSGISWCTDASQELIDIVTAFTDQLVAEEGVLERVLDLLKQLDFAQELEVLTANRALGRPKHYRQVLDLFEDTRLLLAQCLFNWAAQCGLPKAVTLKLCDHLAKYSPNDSRGGMDAVTLTLTMALAYALDVSVLQKREDFEAVVNKHPLIREPNYVEEVMDHMYNTAWECEGLKAMAMFALAVALATLRVVAPQNLQPNAGVLDQDENLVDAAIQSKVFDFLHQTILENDLCFEQEFVMRRLHTLITDFIEFMHSKVTELRARADETARTVQAYQQQHIEPPATVCRAFEMLLLTVGKLYAGDKLNLCLSLDYWGPMELAANYQRSSSRSVSLFKFIRLAGELLPSILFVPYLKMLAGLASCQQSAQNAFNLLKQGCGVAGSTIITWDHFFASMAKYYTSLRVDQYPNSDTVYRSGTTRNTISALELAGLQAVLGVIRAVAEQDEVSRIAICDQPNWAPIQVMLGLVSCSVPITFKAELLLTLTALAKSKRTANQMWNHLEASQIISTIPSIQSKFQSLGLESELEQNESRTETYPLTQAVLELLYGLVTATSEPHNLGSGSRKPGLEPYLRFVMNAIFLRFNTRCYKEPADKWRIAEKCLRILNHFMQTYEVKPSDFQPQQQETNIPPCGFLVTLKLHSESEELKLILSIVDEACGRLETYAPFPGKADLEQCALLCLNILERALRMRDLFFEAHQTANCRVLLAGLNRLLLGVNCRTGRPDHMLNVSKFVMFRAWLPQQALSAVRVLTHVARQPNVSAQLLAAFTATEQLKAEIRYGFVECLDADVDLSDAESSALDLDIKMAVIGLLQDCLPQSAPNLTHYLLGFDITKDVRKTSLQQPGVMDFPSTCIKSLVTILDNHLQAIKTQQVEVSKKQEKLIEAAYNLMHALCFNAQTSEVILRFLRSCNDFFGRHTAELLTFHRQQQQQQPPSPRTLNQMTGLMKCVAIELKQIAANNHLSQFGNLCKILLGTGDAATALNRIEGAGNRMSLQQQQRNMALELSYYSGGGGGGGVSGSGAHQEEMMMGHGSFMAKKELGGAANQRMLLAQLLDGLNFEMQPIDKPDWEVFDNTLMQPVFQSCETTQNGIKLVDIKRLNDVLRHDLSAVHRSMPIGGQLVGQEVESILAYAQAMNRQRCQMTAMARFLEAWGQVVEIVFSVAPQPCLATDAKQTLLLDMLQVILKKVVPIAMILEYANLISSTVLMLLVNLRLCFYHGQDGANGENDHTDPAMAASQVKSTNCLGLKFILRNVVDWIIASGAAGSQKLRINLYTSLLNVMHILAQGDQRRELTAEDVGGGTLVDNHYVSRLDRTRNAMDEGGEEEAEEGTAKGSRSHKSILVEVFTEFGDELIDILCHDAIGGHDVCRMLALACIDVLLRVDPMVNFTEFIARRGYLSHLIDSLQKSDRDLCVILEAQPDNLKALYVYESKMAMLGRLARSHSGAELLIEHKMLGILSTMRCYDLHPDFQMRSHIGGGLSSSSSASSFIPSVELLYQQILFPALSFCDVIISSLGQDNRPAVTQIVHFLLSHGDMIEIVLRAGSPLLKLGLLKELSALTGLVARTANQQLLNYMAEPNANQDVGAHLFRLQKLMLTLFPRFILKEAVVHEIRKEETRQQQEEEEKEGASEHMSVVLQIAANLVMFARNTISNHTASHRVISVLFSPSLNEGVQRTTESATAEVSPNLGIIIAQLKAVVKFYSEQKLAHDSLMRQYTSMASVHLDGNVQSQQKMIIRNLREKKNELKLCVFIVEHCLYLLWAHLDYYMLRAIPVDPLKFNKNYTNLDNHNVLLISSSEAGWRAMSEDIVVLKKHLISVFNETFCNQLITTTQEQTATEKTFMESLLRRIKRLIQFVPIN